MEIRDALEEVVFLEDVRIVVSEWIPFNRNQVMTINDDLESAKRVKSNLFTSRVDTSPKAMTFATDPVFTEVRVRSFDPSRFVRFDAQVYYPEEVVQVERFGVDIDLSGRVLYGLHLLEVDGKPHRVSLDKVSRVLSDVVVDSSTMVDTLLSVFQKRLLDVVFFGDAKERDKFPVIVARSISPHFDDDSRYLDKEEHENELNQVLESVDRVLSLSKGEKLFVGSHGIILVTPDHEAYEEVLSVAAFLCSLQILQRNVSTRMWILWDEVRETRERILSVPESDTEGVSQIQHTLSDISATVVLLDEIAKYMAHAVAAVEGERDDVRKRKDARAARLAEALRLDRQLEMRRDVVKDIAMSVSGLHNEVQGLRDVAATISEKQMRRTNEALEESIAEMQEMNRASERTSSAVEVLEVMMAGSISFSIVNTLPGQYTSPTFSEFAAANPYTWLLIIIAVWAVIGYGLYRIMSLLEWRSEKDLRVHLRFDRKVDIERLRAYLATKEPLVSETTMGRHTALERVIWREEVSGHEAKSQVSFDAASGMLRSLSVDVPANRELTREAVRSHFLRDLARAGVLPADEGG